ncbi:MAG: glycosyltransferase family 4 protein [Bacteroidetes bacterium]|nr:glycosyltransferase family 4 protein [Bacteroidota bacterium]
MKFVFLNYGTNLSFNRPEDWIQRILGYTGILEELGNHNHVISIEQINYEGIFSHNKVDYHFLRLKKWQEKFPFQLHRYVASLNPDIVLVHGMHFPLQLIQLKKASTSKTKIIVQNHAEKPGFRQKLFLQKKADACVDAYLFTSAEMGEAWMKKGVIKRKDKIREVMEASSVFGPIEKKQSRRHVSIEEGPIFLWVGRLDSNKNPVMVVKSFLRFLDHQRNAKLYMIFHTSELMLEIKKILENNTLAKDAIVLVGKVPHEEMLYWYNASDFIISGSYYEGSGVAVCEAMSCGCIPILTDIFSFRKITNKGACGLLYEAGNEQALLSALLKSQEINMEEQRKKVLEQFEKSLSFKAIAAKIQEVAASL